MKIAYIKLTNGYADHLTYQENILPACFVSMGHETHLITMPRFSDVNGRGYIKEAGVYKNGKGVTVHVLPFSKHLKKLSAKFDYYDTLYSVLKTIRPDFIFSQSVQYASIVTVAKFKRENPHVKVVADNHGDMIISPVNSLKYKILQKIIYRSFIKRAEQYIDVFYGVSPSRAEYLAEVYGVNKGKIKVIAQVGNDTVISKYYHDKELNRICQNYNMNHSTIIVAFGAGRIDEKKNLIPLINAVGENQRFSLVIFGTFAESIEKEIKNLLDRFSNVNHIGRVAGDEIYRILIGADIAIFPGRHSILWDNTVACGTPLCVRRWKGMDYFDINSNCIYLEEGTKEEIQSVLVRVSEGDTLREMREAAQGRAKELFSATYVANEILSDMF